jgi:hypothetical protein
MNRYFQGIKFLSAYIAEDQRIIVGRETAQAEWGRNGGRAEWGTAEWGTA